MRQVTQTMATMKLDGARVAQRSWAARPLVERLRVVRRLRRLVASGARELAETVPTWLPGALCRSVADTLVSEVLPLIEACRFLEDDAAWLLTARELGAVGRPLWLTGVETRVERAPWGVVLVIAAANYPLLLAGVQTLQALTAGNAVLWKPAPGTEAVAFAMATLLHEAGLPDDLITVLDSSTEAATDVMAIGVDFVALTGSAATGRAVASQLADSLTPAAMELSGCDAVFALPGAELSHLIDALQFGLRFNGSFTCMAPRRLFLVGLDDAAVEAFELRLAHTLSLIQNVPLPEKTTSLLDELISDAETQGARVVLNGLRAATPAGATLITHAVPTMASMRTDIFAPVLSVMRAASVEEALAAHAACAYGLTAAIFGPTGQAAALASRLRVGSVLVNAVIAPTADPRVAFGGRGMSGYGVTRGAEGLLAMTTTRTVQVQRSRPGRAYEPTGEAHAELFAGLAQMSHGGSLRHRITGLKRLLRAVRQLRK